MEYMCYHVRETHEETPDNVLFFNIFCSSWFSCVQTAPGEELRCRREVGNSHDPLSALILKQQIILKALILLSGFTLKGLSLAI